MSILKTIVLALFASLLPAQAFYMGNLSIPSSTFASALDWEGPALCLIVHPGGGGGGSGGKGTLVRFTYKIPSQPAMALDVFQIGVFDSRPCAMLTGSAWDLAPDDNHTPHSWLPPLGYTWGPTAITMQAGPSTVLSSWYVSYCDSFRCMTSCSGGKADEGPEWVAVICRVRVL